MAYLLSHMLIMPLIYFYIAACGWKAADAAIPNGLHWLFGMGFFNGIVIEIGRKIRSPLDEEQGVATYSALWGPERATPVWIGVMAIATGIYIRELRVLRRSGADVDGIFSKLPPE